MPAVGLLAVGATVLAAGVIVGTMMARRSTDAGLAAAQAPAEPEVLVRNQPDQTDASQAAPALGAFAPVRLEPAVVDLGVLKPGQSVGRDVQIVNNGTTPLTILFSRASCTCTSVDLANTVIPPGGAVPLKIRYDGQMTLGPKSSVVRIGFEGYE
ncbi:MAG: DUF1573 domain-containing protein, partial [Planctomycetota bacterium]